MKRKRYIYLVTCQFSYPDREARLGYSLMRPQMFEVSLSYQPKTISDMKGLVARIKESWIEKRTNLLRSHCTSLISDGVILYKELLRTEETEEEDDIILSF